MAQYIGQALEIEPEIKVEAGETAGRGHALCCRSEQGGGTARLSSAGSAAGRNSTRSHLVAQLARSAMWSNPLIPIRSPGWRPTISRCFRSCSSYRRRLQSERDPQRLRHMIVAAIAEAVPGVDCALFGCMTIVDDRLHVAAIAGGPSRQLRRR